MVRPNPELVLMTFVVCFSPRTWTYMQSVVLTLRASSFDMSTFSAEAEPGFCELPHTHTHTHHHHHNHIPCTSNNTRIVLI